jgi:hypothetical protein
MAAVTGISHMPWEIPPEIPLAGYTGGGVRGYRPERERAPFSSPNDREKDNKRRGLAGPSPLDTRPARTYDIDRKGFYRFFPAQ